MTIEKGKELQPCNRSVVVYEQPENKQPEEEIKATKTENQWWDALFDRSNVPPNSEIPQALTFKAYLLVSSIASFVACVLAELFLLIFWGDIIYWLLILIITVFVFGILLYKGAVKIPIAHNGVIEVFGKPIEDRWFGAGWYWTLFRPLMDIRVVNMEEQVTTIDANVIACGNKNERNKDQGRNKIDVNVKIRVHWKFSNPMRSLLIEEKVITQGLTGLITEVLRLLATDYGDTEFMELKKKPEYGIKQAAQKPSDRWGMKILSVSIERIAPVSAAVRQSYEGYKTEQLDQQKEALERDHVIVSVNKISKDIGLSKKEAAYIFMSERGKMKQNRTIISGDNNNPLLQAAALLSGDK